MDAQLFLWLCRKSKIMISVDPMRGGGVYVKNLVQHLTRLDRANEYILYGSRANASHFEGLGANFQLLRVSSNRLVRILWEQAWLPRDSARRQVDVFHGTGYISPDTRTCRKVTTVHDRTFFLLPERHTFLKRNYFRQLIPLGVCSSSIVQYSRYSSATAVLLFYAGNRWNDQEAMTSKACSYFLKGGMT